MIKKRFYSRLFARYIEKSESDYKAKVIAETLFRIKDLETKNCSCFACSEELQKLKDYYQKIILPAKRITNIKKD